MLSNRLLFGVFSTFSLLILIAAGGCTDPAVKKQQAFEKGLALSKAGDAKKAVLEFRNAIQLDPKFTEARFQLGVSLLQLHSYEAARGELMKVQETEPAREGLKKYLAEALVGAGKYAEGRDLCLSLVSEHPEDATLHEYLSRAYLGFYQDQADKPAVDGNAPQEDWLVKTEAEAGQALALDPKLAEPHMTLARVLLVKGRGSAGNMALPDSLEAEMSAHFDAAKSANPNDRLLRRRIAAMWSSSDRRMRAMGEVDAILEKTPTDAEARQMKAEFLFYDGKLKEAEALLKELTEEKLTSPRMDFLRGRLLFTNGDYTKARDEFKKVKDSPAGGFFLARCQDQLGDRQAAVSQLEQVLKQSPAHDGSRRSLFEMYLKDGNLTKAALHAEEAVKAAPRAPLGYLLRARLAGTQGDWTTAHKALDEALERAPGLFEALMLRADIYMKQGKLDECKAATEDLIKAQPDNGVGYLLRAEAHIELKEYADAEKDAKRALELSPNDLNPRIAICKARVGQGDLDGAGAAYEEILRITPDNTTARFAYSGLCASRKDYDKAVSLLNAIGENSPAYIQARTRIAEIYDIQGNAAAASAEFERVLASHPDAADAAAGMFQHLARSKELGEMEELAKDTLKRDPESALGHLMLSDVYLARGLLVPAADEVSAALKKRPSSARLWFRLGSLDTSAGRFSEALEALQRARQLQPDFDEAALGAARILALTGKGDDAVSLCEKVLAKKPNDLSAILAKADVEAALGKDSEAETAYRGLVSAHPTYLLPYIHLAAMYEKQRESAKVQDVFDAAVAAAPNVPELHVEYGRFWERAKNLEHAREQYLRAIDLSPDNPRVQDMLARVSMGAGNYADAEQRLRDLLAKTPGNSFARLNLALVLEKQEKTEEASKMLLDFVSASKDPQAAGMELTKLFAGKGQYDRIERLAQSLLDADPKNWMAAYILGIARAGQGDTEGALKRFEEATKLNEKTPLAQHAEGLMYARLDKTVEALAAFAAARKIDAHFMPAYMDAALLALRKDDLAGADELCRKATEAEPQAAEPLLLRTAAYAIGNDQDKAMRTLDALLKRDPAQAVGASVVADMLCSKGRFDEAIELCRRCVATSPDSPALVMRLSMVYERAGKLDQAVSEYKRLIGLAPESAMAKNNLAWLLSEQDKLDDALLYAQQAQALMPEHPAMLDTLGWVYLKKGEAEKAIPLLETASRNETKDPRILYHLGKAYMQAGRANDARPVLTQALALKTDFSGAADAKAILDAMPTGEK